MTEHEKGSQLVERFTVSETVRLSFRFQVVGPRDLGKCGGQVKHTPIQCGEQVKEEVIIVEVDHVYEKGG